MSEQPTPSVRDLDRKFVGGVAWTAGGKWSTQLIGWASVIALARILSPEELGLAGIAGVFILLANTLAEFGIGSAVVQIRNLKIDAISQLHTISVLICMSFFGLAVIASPWIAWFFSASEVRWLVVANSLTLIIVGFQSIPTAQLRRALAYDKLTYLEIINYIVRASVSVSAALLGASYWSTVIGGLSARLVATILLAIWVPFRFKFPQWHLVKQPLQFGYRVSISNFTNALTNQVDPLIVAKRLGESALGIYRFAIDIANAPADKINMLIMRVSGPLMASIQSDHVLVRRYFLRIAEPLTLAIFPAVVGFSFVAPNVILLLVGDKWQAAIAPVQFLTLAAGVRALISLVNQVLVAQHDVRFVMRLSMVKFCILPVTFYFISPYGITAIAQIWLAWVPIELGISSLRMMNKVSLKIKDFISMMFPAAIGCIVMATVLYAFTSSTFQTTESGYLQLASEVLLGVVTYTIVVFGLFRSRLVAYYNFAKKLRATRD